MGTLLGSAIASRDFVAIHMTWGAVNELTTLTAYHRMIAKTENEALIQHAPGDHQAGAAALRVLPGAGEGPSGREPSGRGAIVRWSLDHLWAPVGTGVRPQVETDFVVTYLFNDADGVVALKEMDGTIAELPGLGGTHYLSEAAEGCAARIGLPFGLLSDYRRSPEDGPSFPRGCP